MTKKRIHLIYGIVLSLSLIVAGICLGVACVRIFQGTYLFGGSPFSREAVAAAFTPIAVPVYICLVLLIGSFILHIFLPQETSKKPAEKQYDVILERLHGKLNKESCDMALYSDILKLHKQRKVHSIVCIGLLAICSIVFLIYGLNIANFPKGDATGSVIRAMRVFVPCILIPFAYTVFAAYAKKASVIKEIELVKKAISAGSQPSSPKSEKPADSKKNALLIVKYCILAVAVVLTVYGFFTGGTADVLKKAVAICKECVGLG